MFAVWIKRIAIFHLVCFAWLFFRADSFTRAFEMLAGLRVWDWNDSYWVAAKFVLIFSAPLLLLDLWLEKTGDEYAFQSSTVRRKLAFAATTVLIMALYGANRANAFIYFQF
jgi:hypothetical protein